MTAAIEAAAAIEAPIVVDADVAARRLECLKLAGSHIGMSPGAKNVEEIARRYVRFIERGKFGDK